MTSGGKAGTGGIVGPALATPETQTMGAVGTSGGIAQAAGSSAALAPIRAHRDKDVHTLGTITPRGHVQQKPLEGQQMSRGA